MNTASLLTAPGPSALATVRLAGDGVARFLADRFSRPPVVGRCVHGELRDDDGVIDDPVCVLNADGSVDLTLHGNPWIVTLVLALATAHGFEESPATCRATRIADEVAIALPLVRTDLAARMLLAQSVAWSRPIEDPRAVLADRALERLLTPPTVAIVGVPNAGKSTLANALFGQRRSIVSDAPGTTRDWVGELANLDGLVVTLIDTPGRRETADPIEAAAIALSDAPIASADLVIVLLDAARDDAEQRALRDRFPGAIVAANKADVAPAPDGAIALVTRDGVGLDAMIRAIHAWFGLHDRPIDAPRLWTADQRERFAAGEPLATHAAGAAMGR